MGFWELGFRKRPCTLRSGGACPASPGTGAGGGALLVVVLSSMSNGPSPTSCRWHHQYNNGEPQAVQEEHFVPGVREVRGRRPSAGHCLPFRRGSFQTLPPTERSTSASGSPRRPLMRTAERHREAALSANACARRAQKPKAPRPPTLLHQTLNPKP